MVSAGGGVNAAVQAICAKFVAIAAKQSRSGSGTRTDGPRAPLSRRLGGVVFDRYVEDPGDAELVGDHAVER
jgi:hypothetical protein